MVGTSNQSVPKMAIDRVNINHQLKPVSGLHPLLGLEEAYTTPAGLHWGISFWGVDSPEIRLIYIYICITASPRNFVYLKNLVSSGDLRLRQHNIFLEFKFRLISEIGWYNHTLWK